MKFQDVIDKYSIFRIFEDFSIDNNREYNSLYEVCNMIKVILRNHHLIGYYNIFLPKEESEHTKKFIELLQPEPYFNQEDCGVYLRGLEGIDNEIELNLIDYILSNNTRSTLYCVDIEERKLSFISGHRSKKAAYIKASEKVRQLFYDYMCKMMKLNAYRAIPIKYEEALAKQYCDSDVISLIMDIGLSKAEATKFMMLHNIRAKNLILESNNYDLDRTVYDMYDELNPSKLYCLLLWTYLQRNGKNFNIAVRSSIWYKLLEAYAKELEDYLNKHKEYLLFEVCKKFYSYSLNSDMMYYPILLLNIDKYNVKLIDGIIELERK